VKRPPQGSLAPAADECEVRPEDLRDVAKIQKLLGALNDPYANVVALTEDIRVLAARCVRTAQRRSVRNDILSVGHALSLLGNKGVEAELLGVLEDLTVLKAELEAGEGRVKSK
jgi:hypothetical protein